MKDKYENVKCVKIF